MKTHHNIITIQMLRAIAVLGVVYAHCAGKGFLSDIKVTGSWGVDIFSIISGFIIAYIVSKDTSDFIKKRLFRIVPLYFIATLSVVLIAVLFPNLVPGTKLSIGKVVKSLCFIPYKDSFKDDFPVLGQGWTLRFELFFYLSMFVCILFVKNKKYLATTCALALGIFITVINMFKPEVYILEYFGDGILPEFIYGLLLFVGYNYLKNRTIFFELKKDKKTIMIIFCSIIAVFCLAWLILGHIPILGFYFFENRNLSQGIPALILTMALLTIEEYINKQNKYIKMLVLIGDSSYTMYLFHIHIIAFLSHVIFFRIVGHNPIFIIELIELFFTIITTKSDRSHVVP